MGVLSQIRRKSANGENVNKLEAEYIGIMGREPLIPVLPELFFEDVTQEALALQISDGWASASLWSDEGALVLNSHGMQNNTAKFVALLNRLWDGKPFTAHRKTSKNITVSNRRLTVSLMMQPLILQQMLAKNNDVNRQSGFMARSLMAFPDSARCNQIVRMDARKRFYNYNTKIPSTIQSHSRETKKRQSDSNAHRPSLSQ